MNKRRCEVEDCQRLVLSSSLELMHGGLMCKKCRKKCNEELEQSLKKGTQWDWPEMIS